MRQLRQQIANTVYIMESRNNPLPPTFTINHRPNIIGVVVESELKIFSEGFKPMPTPNIEFC